MSTWVKVFNSMPQHPKLLAAGDRAAWLHICGLCYSNEHLTDGFVPSRALPVVAPGVKRPEALAAKLVQVGLWHGVEGGWRIHDYGEYQRSSVEIRSRRAADSERKAAYRSKRSPNGSPHGHFAESHVESHAESEAIDKKAEGRRQKAEGRKASANAPASQRGKRAANHKVDQAQPPAGFPAELQPALSESLQILVGAWQERGGLEPQPRGVGLAILRNPKADHGAVARKLVHWLTAGTGQRAQSRDIAARFGDWIANEGDAQRPGNVVAIRRENASDWLRDMGFVGGEAS